MVSDRTYSLINYYFLINIPVAIIIAFLVPVPEWDYKYYEIYWNALLQGQNPYSFFYPDFGITMSCPYPIGFLSFSGLYYFHFLFPKIFFCLIWLLTAFILNKICKELNVSDRTTVIYCVGVMTLHPLFYIRILLNASHYDSIVGLSILLAIYYLDKSNQIKSGFYAVVAFLFKFIGLILLFPMIFIKKKIRLKVALIFGSIGGFIYLIGFLLWGTNVFEPFITHLIRNPEGASILLFLENLLGIDISKIFPILLISAAFLLAIFLYFFNDDVTTYSLILIISFILILPVFFMQYVLWFIPLTIYWSIKHNDALLRTIIIYSIILHLSFFLWELFGDNLFSPFIAFIASIIFLILVFMYKDKKRQNFLEIE
ncbi:MAG: hypothetical protein ACTSYB_00325 [Candidatus Helarchaeota archaeon]